MKNHLVLVYQEIRELNFQKEILLLLLTPMMFTQNKA